MWAGTMGSRRHSSFAIEFPIEKSLYGCPGQRCKPHAMMACLLKLFNLLMPGRLPNLHILAHIENHRNWPPQH